MTPAGSPDGGASALAGAGRAAFLTTRPDPVFAMVHIPSPRRRSATGVIVAPAFPGEDLCNYRVRRAWAEALAEAGHPALRLDLPGMGDSAGSPGDGDRLSVWRAALRDAALWLRAEADCPRITALGIGFGGMLAWLAAADGAPIDDLILWGVPTTGRRLLREVKAAGLLEIKHDLELEALLPPSPSVSETEVVLDVAGQVMGPATVAELTAVDLLALELPEPESRRVLVYQRDEAATDAELCGYFHERGADLAVADGSSYGAMMRYVEIARVPNAAIIRSVRWLSGSDGAGRRPSPVPEASLESPAALESLEFSQDGSAVRETVLTLEIDSVALRGILTEPVTGTPADLCAVFFSGGADRRIGPNRLWVDLARRWAAHGVSSVRLDGQGIGDSDGDSERWASMRGYYDPSHIAKTVAVLDALEARGLPARFVLVGFCSGGYRSFQVARIDRRIAGVFAIAFPFFFWSRWTVTVRHSWVGRWRRRPGDSPPKAAVLWTLRALWRATERLRRTCPRYLRRRPDKVERSLALLEEAGTELLLLYSSRSLEYQDLFRRHYMEQIEATVTMRVERIPGPDVRFRPLALQRFVGEELDAALARVLDARSALAREQREKPALARMIDASTPPSEAAERHGGAGCSRQLRTLVIAQPRKAAADELRSQAAADLIPDIVGPDDAIGATHVDQGYLAALEGFPASLCRRLPLSLAQPLAVLLRGRHYDAVVTWSDRPAIVMAALMLGFRRRPAHVAILMWPSKRKKAIPLRVVQRGIDCFVAGAPLQRRFLEERLGIERERIVDVRGQRIDTRFWRPLAGAGDVICSVGQEMRDYATLVTALEPLDIPCHIAPGTGLVGVSVARWWRESLAGRSLPATITVATKTYAELRQLYARSRFVVVPLLPSDMDNGVTTVLEAFAMGRTVICTDSPGQVGLIEHGVNGLLVPPGDPAALRSAMLALWQDHDRCARMGAAARETVLKAHGIDRWTMTLVEAVGNAVAARAVARPMTSARVEGLPQ